MLITWRLRGGEGRRRKSNVKHFKIDSAIKRITVPLGLKMEERERERAAKEQESLKRIFELMIFDDAIKKDNLITSRS
jgi:hypothetical protein